MTKGILVSIALVAQVIAVQLNASEIHDAAAAGDVAQVRALLEADPALVSARDTALCMPLHRAAFHGQTAVIELLLEKGADIEAGDRENTTALTTAAMLNKMEAVRLLVERGASVTAKDINGATPLLAAARRRNTEMVKYLVEHGASVAEVSPAGSSCLHIAASIGADTLVTYLLTQEMDLNVRNNNGMDPLDYAIFNRHTGIALELIAHGADINSRNGEGETRLHVAAWSADTAIAVALVAGGLAVDVRDNYGVTPLANTGWGNLPMAQWLIAHGADVNARTDSTFAPLSRAVMGGNAEIVRLMVSHGADVNYHGRNSGPPLQPAVAQGSREMAEILLDAGAEVNFADRIYGRTMLHFAAINGDSAMAQLLLDHGASLEPRDTTGRTPLYYAVHYANPTVEALLTAKGAALTSAEMESRPANMLAERMGEKEAAVWYLGHSGWAVKTANHLLVFDYMTRPSMPDRPGLANGRIDPQEIKDVPVTVFSSHQHGDHYDSTMFDWREAIPNITYVLGHQPRGVTGYQYMAPRTDQTIDGVRIRTIASTDAGVGFLVEVDGLAIFHAGDHANGQVGLHEQYTGEIDYIASLGVPIDLAFLPITGCSLGNPESVREGVHYALNKLTPAVFFPQHAMNGEYRIREFADDLRANGFTVPVGCAENGGDCFHYRDHGML